MRMKSIFFFLVVFLSYTIASKSNDDSLISSEDFTKFVVDDFNNFLKSTTAKVEPSLRLYDCMNIAIAVYIATAMNYKTDIESNKQLLCAVFGWLLTSDYIKNQYTKQHTSFTKSILLTGLIVICRQNQDFLKNCFKQLC